MNLNEGNMKTPRDMNTSASSWFKIWFDTSFYHQLYGHRNELEAKNFVDNLLSVLQPSSSAKMLDLGCGAGRHAKHLASKGFRVTGIDLAGSSVQQAKQFERGNLQFYQHDMRVPFGRNYFDYVFNFFTSFGYFDTDEEHSKVICNISQSLKPGGVVMMDYLNVVQASGNVVSEQQKNIDGVEYHISRWMDEKHFFKKITIDLQSGEPYEYTEKVARLKKSDFERMFEVNDLALQGIYGDYDLGDFDINHSPRLILVAKRR
ncbi:MAG TPA: class I SAM-dependent methyltransferase [Chryseolinea sp.]|nr:class I SAM-dependent methyltransferase [Chryseolinea sp.]